MAPVIPAVAAVAAVAATTTAAPHAEAIGPLPQSLATLVVGQRLAAVVVSVAASGETQLKTPEGVISTQPSVSLPIGAELTLAVRAVQPRLQFRLLTIAAPATPATTAGLPAAGDAATGAVLASHPAPSSPPRASAAASPAGVVPASPSAAAGMVAASAVTGPPGAAARLLAMPAAAAAIDATVGATAANAVAGPIAQSPLPGPPTSGVQPAFAPAPTPSVIGIEAASEIVVSGWPSDGAPPSGGPASLPAIGAASENPRFQWPALVEALRTLTATAPAIAATTALPRPESSLAAAMATVLSAQRRVDVRRLLGEAATNMLERSRPDLVRAIAEELRTAAADADPDWRQVSIPIVADGEITQIRLSLRRHARDDAGADAEARGRRFMVDVVLSRLGRLRIDGWAQDDGRRLELVVRTGLPLPAAVRDGIRSVFRDVTAASGVSGGVGFRVGPEAPTPRRSQPEPPPRGAGVIV